MVGHFLSVKTYAIIIVLILGESAKLSLYVSIKLLQIE